MTHVKKYIVDMSAALALLLTAGVVGCGQANTGSGSGSGAPGGADNMASAGDDGTGASSGSSSGSAGSSGSGTTTGGGSSGSATTGSSGGSKTSSGGGGTTSSGSGGAADSGIVTDLEAPPAGTGMQIATPDYNASDPNAKNLIVQPNQEIFLCYYVTLPNTAEIDIGGFQSFMTFGSSHHFIVYQGGGNTAFGGPSEPSGTINACSFGAGTWIYATSTPGEVVSMNMPKNVGLPMPAATQLILNMHFINTGTTPVYPKVKLNILYAQNVQYKAGVMVSFNSGINVPPATAAGPGTQTVSGTCTAPVGSNFFIMSTHTHKHATAAIVDFIHNGQSQEIVHTGTETTYPADQEQGSGVDWEHPGVGAWNAPSFLTTAAGDSFKYSCAYTNTGTTAVTVGEYAATNERCMSIGYYYPAGTATCN
jgi:hypothetical protein